MADLNRILIIGNLGGDPESRFTPTGRQLTRFTVATHRKWTDSDDVVHTATDWFNVECWNGTGEAVVKYLSKGRLVLVQGKLRIDQYEQDGKTQYYTKVVASSVQFLDWPKDAAPEEDLPF